MSNNDYLKFVGLCKAYPSPASPGGSIMVVDRFDLAVAQGEFVSIIGHSGCGKSTVLSMAAGLTESTSGSVELGAHEVDGPGPDRAVVFQSPSLLPWMTALENVMLGVKRVFPHGTKAERADICRYFLAKVGLAGSLHKKAADLSQGMRQRVGIARAFALKPKLLLLDEPFGMLDSLTRGELQQVLMEVWATHRITAIMVTHDVDEALFLSDRVVMMTNGPHAHVGEILEVPFARPRLRAEVAEHPAYYELRGSLIGFLEDHGKGGKHAGKSRPRPPAPPEGSGAAPENRPGEGKLPWYRQLVAAGRKDR
jgi:nitrate/nitrite transport system ATP-binding protein